MNIFNFIIGEPSYAICVIPTDNRFPSAVVKKRWNYIRSEFKKLGVEVISYASDGDSRYFSVMKNMVNFGTISTVFDTSCPVNMTNENVVFQDTPHKTNNMKNCFMDKASNLRMGNFKISTTHFIILMREVPKNVHLLNESEVSNVDRMDFTVIHKIADENICSLLLQKVSNSAGTVEFLKILRNLLDAFTLPGLSASQRVFRAFYALFMLRIWRCWCMSSSDASLKNFVSYEAFVAIEINSWCLIKLIRQCRDKYGERAFQIHLFNSQNCEHFFGLLRALTSTFCTQVNTVQKSDKSFKRKKGSFFIFLFVLG
jgi:hypothetical protein